MPPTDMAKYMLDRYYRRKDQAIKSLGGVCYQCGSCESLQFHHVNPGDKSFAVGSVLNGVSESKLALELSKCRLLCAECHRAVHRANPEHGSATMYINRGCRCDECRRGARDRMRVYRANKKMIASGVTVA